MLYPSAPFLNPAYPCRWVPVRVGHVGFEVQERCAVDDIHVFDVQRVVLNPHQSYH
jgi:hypothetical protein